MEELSKEKAQELHNKIEIAILQSLTNFGKTSPENSICAICATAFDIIFTIAEKNTNSRKEAFEVAITILNLQKEHFLNQAKKESYDLENL